MQLSKSVLVIMLFLIISSALAKENSNAAKPAPTRLANPASVKCIKDGFKLQPQKSANGVVSAYDCVNTQNNKRCDEWAYFRNECSLK